MYLIFLTIKIFCSSLKFSMGCPEHQFKTLTYNKRMQNKSSLWVWFGLVQISFSKDCGEDDVCFSDLVLTVQSEETLG